MRYIHKFELPLDRAPDERLLEFRKKEGAADLGQLIGSVIGYEKDKFHKSRWNLEIQAFPQSKWDEFKKDLKSWIEAEKISGIITLNLIIIGKLIKTLEEFRADESPEPTDYMQIKGL